MNPSSRKSLPGNFRPLLLAVLIFLSFSGYSQTYNPSLHVTANDAIGLSQSTPVDSRSMFYDATNFVYRPYQSVAEVKSYLNLSKYRVGGFLIIVDSGGVLQPGGFFTGGVNNFWIFKDGTADVNLVEMNLFGTSGCAGCLLAANNLSDVGNAATARTNLSLGLMATQSTTASSTDLSGTWPSGLTVNSVQGANLANLRNYLNLTNVPAIPAQLNPTQGGLITISGTYPNLTFFGNTPSFEQTLLKLNTTSQIDSINTGAFVFRIFGTSALGVPSGTTAQRPSSPSFGDTRANSDSTGSPLETWNGSAWIHPSGGGGGGGSGITALTGDVLASGTGSVVATLATVNSNVFGSNTFLKFAVTGKGVIPSATAVVSGDITGALGFTPYNATNPSGYIALTALSATPPLAYNNTTGVFSMPAAATAQNGYLTSTDWNTFNGKLTSALTSGNIFLGNGSNVAASVTPSGDWTMTNAGVSTIANNAITTVKILNSNVTYGKIQNATQQALLGAPAAGAYQEITLGTNLSITGGVLNATTAGAQTLTYTQNATNNNLAISGGNSQNFLAATSSLAGLLDTARAKYIDSLKNGLKTFSIFTHNGIGQTGGDSLQLGLTPFDQNTTLNTAGFDFLITNLPNKSTALSTDSLWLLNAAGKSFKFPIPIGGITQLSGDVTAGPGAGLQTATISALAVTTGKIAANAVTLGKMSTNASNTLLGFDGSGNPADITAGTGISILSGVISSTGGGGGSGATGHNALGDSLTNSSGAILTQDNDNAFTTPHQFRYAQKSISAQISSISDTTFITADSAQAVIMIWAHSFGEGAGRYDQHIITAARSKYHIPFGGPGYIGGLASGVYGYTGYTTNGWTLRSSQTSPIGRGPDSYSWMGVVGDTLSVSAGVSTADYLAFTNLKVMYYDTTTGGSFSTIIDGVPIDTTNTATGTAGFNVKQYNGLSNQSHRVTFKEITAGTTNVELLGIIGYSRSKRSMYIENCSAGGTKISDFVTVNVPLQIQELKALAPNLIIMDWTINSIKAGVDTLTVGIQVDTMLRRARAALPYTDLTYVGPTDFGYARWGTPPSPLPAYTRSVERSCRRDTANFFDFYQIVGPFQFAILNNTLTSDSLHPAPQAFNTFVAEYFNLNGAINSDTAATVTNIYGYNGVMNNTDVSGPFRLIDAAGVSNAIHWKNTNDFTILGTTGGSSLKIAPTTAGTVFFTNSSGTAGTYNIDGIVQSNKLITSGAVTNTMAGSLAVGAGGSTGGTLDANVTSGAATFTLKSTDATKYPTIAMNNNTGQGLQIIVPGTSAAIGDLRASNTAVIGSLLGDMIVGAAGSFNLKFFTGSFATANERARFFSGGDFSIGTTSDLGLLGLAAGSTSKAPLVFTAGAPTTTLLGGQFMYNTGLYIVDSSASVRDTIATRSWTRNNTSGGGPVIASGTYIPTLTNTTNVSASTVINGFYTRIGNIVTVTITGTITPTLTATSTLLTFTLPITTSTSPQGTIGSGVSNTSGAVTASSGLVALPSTTTANFGYLSTSIVSTPFSVSFQYTL